MALTRIKFNQVATNTASFDDPLLLLNKLQTGTNDKDSGFVVERGDDINVAFIWDESAGEFAAITTHDTAIDHGNVPVTAYANLKVNNLDVSGTVGNITIAGNITPTADITYDLGSPTKQWKDIYVGPGSLYVNGQKVLQDDSGTITFSADADQNIRIKTTGNGILQLGTATTTLQVDSTLQLSNGKRITDSAGIEVGFGDNIQMNSNRVVGLGNPSADTDATTKAYVDNLIDNISTGSIEQGNSSVAVVDSGSGTVIVTVDGSTALTVTSDGVVVAGNFTVSGTTTTVNSNTIALADNIITLNSDASGTPTQNAGIEVERGDEANVQLRWNEGLAKWTFTNDGATYLPVSVNTSDLAEGSNLYYTDTRARASLSVSTSTGVNYNSSTGVVSLNTIPNSSLANNSVTVNGATVALGASTSFSTSAVSEGSNLYYTDTRVRDAISVSGSGGSYNNSTGVITIIGAVASVAGKTGDVSLVVTDIANAASETYVNEAVASAILTKDNTDEITEGSTNLYFTNGRARSAIAVTGSLTYNSAAGIIGYTTPTTIASLSNHNTDALTEGINLYYTDVRANSAIDTRVSKTFVDALNVDADTLDGLDSTAFATATQGATADTALQPNTVVTVTSISSSGASLANRGSLIFYDSDGTHYVALRSSGTVTGNVTWSLPSADGTPGQVLTTDGAGNWSFTAASSSGGASGFQTSTITTAPGAGGDYDLARGTDQNADPEDGFALGSSDPFGVSLGIVYDAMEPVGSIITVDFGDEEAYVGA